MEVQIRAQSAPWYRGVELYIGDPTRRLRVAEIKLEQMQEATESPPSFVLDERQAQTLMDDLWASGVRPTEGSGSAGSMRATERHLADMRSIAFAKLKITKP